MHWNGQQKLLGGGGGLNRFYVEKKKLGSAGSKTYKVFGPREKLFIYALKQQSYKSRSHNT